MHFTCRCLQEHVFILKNMVPQLSKVGTGHHVKQGYYFIFSIMIISNFNLWITSLFFFRIQNWNIHHVLLHLTLWKHCCYSHVALCGLITSYQHELETLWERHYIKCTMTSYLTYKITYILLGSNIIIINCQILGEVAVSRYIKKILQRSLKLIKILGSLS